MKKRLFSLFFLLVLLLTMLPMAAYGEEPGEGEPEPPAEPEPPVVTDSPAEPEPPVETDPPAATDPPTGDDLPIEPDPVVGPGTETGGKTAVTATPAPTTPPEDGEEQTNAWGLLADDVIWFGFYDEAPVPWLILNAGQTNMGTDGLFLLSRDLIDKSKVMHDSSSTIWEGSLSQQWCTTFAETAFSAAENTLVIPTSKHDEFVHLFLLDWSEMDLKDEQIFFPSAQEMALYFGSESGDSYVTLKPCSMEENYWLRSTPEYHYGNHGMVLQKDTVHDYAPNHHWSARPCMNLSLQDALWVLPAQDEGLPGPAARPGASEEESREWKLLVPAEESTFRAEATGEKDGLLSLHYSGAATGEGAMLSLLVRDENDEPLALWRVMRPVSAEGDLELDLEAMEIPEDARLYLFCEELGGENRTNYASALQELGIAAVTPSPKPAFSGEDSSGQISLVTPEPIGRRHDRAVGMAGRIIAMVLLGLLALGLLSDALRKQSVIPVVLLILLLLLAAIVDLRAGFGFFPGL